MRHLLIPYTFIQALRIGNVIEPHEYERDFPKYIKSPEVRKRNAWAYIDARDLGQICDLCVSKDGLGFQVFNATNDTITATFPTKQFLEQYAPTCPIDADDGPAAAATTAAAARTSFDLDQQR